MRMLWYTWVRIIWSYRLSWVIWMIWIRNRSWSNCSFWNFWYPASYFRIYMSYNSFFIISICSTIYISWDFSRFKCFIFSSRNFWSFCSRWLQFIIIFINPFSYYKSYIILSVYISSII